jgi:hypothetical protein
MGFVPQSGSTDEIKVYLTELGRRRLLEQGFIPTQFSISDEDGNYNALSTVDQIVTDITGDYNDNVYAISKNITIKGQILRN